MKTSLHHAKVSWDADPGDARAHTVELADQRIAASSAPEFGGDGSKADPEELFVASLSTCHMLWFLALARGEGAKVASYEDEAEGTLDGERFVGVTLRPRVAFEGEVDEARLESLHHRAHERCFISNSVNFPIEVEPRP